MHMLHKTQAKPSRVVAGAQRSSNATGILFLIPKGCATIAQCFNIGKNQRNRGPVPKGRLSERTPFQPSLRDLMTSALIDPTLKRWAIVVCPTGTKLIVEYYLTPFFGLKPSGIRAGALRSGPHLAFVSLRIFQYSDSANES